MAQLVSLPPTLRSACELKANFSGYVQAPPPPPPAASGADAGAASGAASGAAAPPPPPAATAAAADASASGVSDAAAVKKVGKMKRRSILANLRVWDEYRHREHFLWVGFLRRSGVDGPSSTT